jgi:hypothetical protein
MDDEELGYVTVQFQCYISFYCSGVQNKQCSIFTWLIILGQPTKSLAAPNHLMTSKSSQHCVGLSVS